MARRKPGSELPKLTSWDDVDLALCEIGEHERAIGSIELSMQQTIDDAKLAAKDASEPHKAAIDSLSRQVKAYAELNRADLDKRKSKPLVFGSIGWRKSTKVILPAARDALKALVQNLYRRGWDDCIIQPDPKINKDAIKDKPIGEVIDLGIRMQVEDAFWLETAKDVLPATEV